MTRQIAHLGDELLTGLAPIAEDYTKGLLPLFVKAQVATLGAAQCSSIFVHLEQCWVRLRLIDRGAWASVPITTQMPAVLLYILGCWLASEWDMMAMRSKTQL